MNVRHKFIFFGIRYKNYAILYFFSLCQGICVATKRSTFSGCALLCKAHFFYARKRRELMINREYKNPKIVWHCAFIRIMYIITLVVGLLAFLIGVITAESLDDISLSLWVYCFMISVPSCGIALFDLKETKTLNELLYALSVLFALSCFILQLITFSLPGFFFILYEIIALSVIIYRTINIPTNIEASVSSIKKYNLTVVRLWKILFATIIGD